MGNQKGGDDGDEKALGQSASLRKSVSSQRKLGGRGTGKTEHLCPQRNTQVVSTLKNTCVWDVRQVMHFVNKERQNAHPPLLPVAGCVRE